MLSLFFEFVSRLILKNSRLSRNTLKYPIFPGRYFLIGLFGGSCAYGFNSEISLAEYFNDSDLRIDGKKVKVITLARPGWPSINVQALLAKKLVKNFDLILFWEGQNDYSFISARRSGTFKKFEDSFKAGVNDILREFTLLKRIVNLSCLYQILVIGLQELNEWLTIEQENGHDIDQLLTTQRIILKSPSELDDKIRIEQRYADELISLTELAHENDTKLICLTIANNDLWPPAVSSVDPIQFELAKLKSKELTLALIDNNINKHSTILSSCTDLHADLDKSSAIFLFHLGINSLITRNEVKYFDEAFNFDLGTIPGRSNQRARSTITTTISSKGTVRVYDLDSEFKSYLTNIDVYESLFSDLQHLSSIGNLLTFTRVLDLLRLLNLDVANAKILKLVNSDMDITTSFNLILKYLNFSTKFDQRREQVLLDRLKWHISISRFYPCHEELFLRCVEIQKEWECVNSKTNYFEMKFWKGLSNLVYDFKLAKVLLEDVKANAPETYLTLLLSKTETGEKYLELVRFLFAQHKMDFLSLDVNEDLIHSIKEKINNNE